MNAKVALHIAEHLWDDTVKDGSLLDCMVKLTPTLTNLKNAGKMDEVEAEVSSLQSEIVARWANIIMETEPHIKGEELV